MAEAEVHISNELTASNDINVHLYKDYIYAIITKIRSSGKRPDTTPIFSYLVKNTGTNINEEFLEKILTSTTKKQTNNTKQTNNQG